LGIGIPCACSALTPGGLVADAPAALGDVARWGNEGGAVGERT
jgi:hypothetical protein